MGMHSAQRPARDSQEVRFRLKRTLQPRFTRTQLIITAMFVVLGFGTMAAIQGNSSTNILENTRQSDLVSMLDDLAQREARLQAEVTRLENSRETLLGGDQYQALTEAKRRAAALGKMAGTEPISGAGITIDISGNLTAVTLLDAIQELRDAGATAIQISDRDLKVRVVVNTWFADSDNGVTVSGTALAVPITISVIGDATVLKPALQIPGGLADTIGSGGATVTISDSLDVEITAVVPLPPS